MTTTETTKAKPDPKVKTSSAKFEALVVQLSAADAAARGASADATQARAQRSTVAVDAIKQAHADKLEGSAVRKALLDGGVLKGTVSKIITILTSLADGHITTADIKSLNGAYNKVREVNTILAGGGTPGAAAVASAPAPVSVPLATATPDDAVKIILDAIKNAKDPFKASSVWLTRITNEITDLSKKLSDSEDEK